MGWKGLLLLSGGSGKESWGRGPSAFPACSSEKDRLRPLLGAKDGEMTPGGLIGFVASARSCTTRWYLERLCW